MTTSLQNQQHIKALGLGINTDFIKCGPTPLLRNWRELPNSQLTRAERNMRFCEAFLFVPDGDDVGKPIRLAWFQEMFFYSIFDNVHMTRVAILSMARKNAKTATIAMILICFLEGPEAKLNAQIVSGALSRKQAGIVFKLARQMIILSPRLRDRVKIIPSDKILVGLTLNVEYTALSAEAGTTHGLSPYLAILDEMGQVKGPQSDFIDAVTTAQLAHSNPLLIIISTQAPTDADWLSIQIDDAMRSQNPRTVCHLYAAENECGVLDKEAWKAANPALGLFFQESELIEAAEKAERMPSFENTFRNLHLNQRIDAEAPFVSKSVWELNGAQPESLVRKKVYGGLDLSAVSDLTGLVLVGENGSVECFAWLPRDGLREKAKNDRVPYDVWERQGRLIATPGKAIEYEWVAHQLKRLFESYDIQQINFDRYNMKFLTPWLEKAGLTKEQLAVFKDFGQGVVSMSPALRALETSLLQGQLKHGNNPVLAMCAANARVEMDAAGNRKFTKKKSSGRIDLLVCLAMAEDARLAHKKTETKEWSLHFM